MTKISINKSSPADLEALAIGLGDVSLQERAEELRHTLGRASSATTEQTLAFNIKKAWAELYGADVALWPEGLKNSLETINAGIGFGNFAQNVTSALQNLRIDDVTYPAFEAGVAVIGSSSLQAALVELNWRTLKGATPKDTGLIPDSAARAGLSFVSSPLTLIAPIWIGGMAGRATTAGVVRAGEVLALTEKAVVSLGTLIGLTAESAAFVGASDVIQRVAEDSFAPSNGGVSPAGIGRSKDLRYILEQTAAATFFFGGLRLFGWAGQLAQRLLPATETGVALAKLAGHTASVLGLASMEEVQEVGSSSLQAALSEFSWRTPRHYIVGGQVKGATPNGPINRATTYYEKLWRAFFLHATISGVRKIVSVEGVKSEAEDIRGRAEELLFVAQGFSPATIGRSEGLRYTDGRSKDLRYKLMMSTSDDRPPSERDSLLQYVPGYRGKVPPEEQRGIIARLDELEPTEEFPSIAVTLADKASYLFKGGRKVLSDITDVLQDGESVTVTHNFPGKVFFARMTKLGEHVVSVEVLENGMVPGPRHVTLFIKIRDRVKGGVSVHPVTFPAGNLNDLRGANTVMLVKGVRVRPAYDGDGMLDRFEATIRSRPGLELDVDKFVIPAGVLVGGTIDTPEIGASARGGSAFGGSSATAVAAKLALSENSEAPFAEEPSNVIDISARLGGRAEAPPARPGSVTKLWPKGIDSLKRGLKVLFGRETKVNGEEVCEDPRVMDIERLFRHPDDRARFERLTECSMEEAVRLLRAGDPKLFTVVGRRMRNIFNTFITIGQYAEDPDMLAELFSTPTALAEADSDARVMKAFIRSAERDPWLLKGLEGGETDMFRAGMGSQIRSHYESAKRGLEAYRSWREPYPGTNPDGTVDLNGGLPLYRILKGLFTPLRREGATDTTPRAEPRQGGGTAEVLPLSAVEIPFPSLPFAELAKNPTIRPRLKLALKIAEAGELVREDAWAASEPIAVAIVGCRPLTDEARQGAAEKNVALIDRFIAGTELDIVVIGGIEEQHISEMDRASKIGTVVAAFPTAERGVMLMREKLEAAGWRSGIGRLGGRLAIMAVKTVHVAQGFSPATIGRPEGLRYKLGEDAVAPQRPPTVKWDGRKEDPALAPTVQALVAGGDQPTEMMIGGGPGGRMVEKIVKPFSPQLKGVLNGPVMEKLLKAIPDTDEAMIELAGHVYKIVFLQGLTIGEDVKSRIDMVADIATRMGDTSKVHMKFAPYEEGQLRLFAEVFDSIASAAANPEQRPYAVQLISLLAGSGRDISNILRTVGRYAGKKYPSNGLIDSVR